MKTVSYRIESDILALIDTWKVRGFGNSATDVVRRAVVVAAGSKPGEWAEAWAEWRKPDIVVAPVVVEEKVVTEEMAEVIEEPAAPIPQCEECGDAFAPGNDRFCELHVPVDSF